MTACLALLLLSLLPYVSPPRTRASLLLVSTKSLRAAAAAESRFPLLPYAPLPSPYTFVCVRLFSRFILFSRFSRSSTLSFNRSLLHRGICTDRVVYRLYQNWRLARTQKKYLSDWLRLNKVYIEITTIYTFVRFVPVKLFFWPLW